MPYEPEPDPPADVECCAMMAPLAVYVTRTRTGAFKEAYISNRPPEGAEVHLRTYDPAEAQSVAARLRLTLAPSFNAEAFRGEKPYYPHSGPNGRPRKAS